MGGCGTLFGMGYSVLMLAVPVLIALLKWLSPPPAIFGRRSNLAFALAVCKLLPLWRVAHWRCPPSGAPAFPSTYLTTDIPYYLCYVDCCWSQAL